MAPDEESTQEGEIRRGLAAGQNREQAFFRRIVGSIQSDMVGDPTRLAMYVRLFEREMISDTRTFATGVTAEHLGDNRVALNGYVMFEENRTSIARLFEFLQFEVENQLEVLPSSNLGDKKFAFVSSSRAFAYDKPQTPRETLTESYLGEPIHLLRLSDNDHALVMTHEGYIGHMGLSSLHRVDESEFELWQRGSQVLVRRDQTADDLFIPMGSRLRFVSRSESEGLRVELPDGRQVILAPEHCVVLDGSHPPAVDAAIQAAKVRMGRSYVWGGKTSEGVDCSGLVQSSFRTVGVNLPRDTYMQAYVGTVSATRWRKGGLRAGDLLFFVGRNGRINHVAISLGGLRYIEAAGQVKMASMDPNDEDYDERRTNAFVFAKRLYE